MTPSGEAKLLLGLGAAGLGALLLLARPQGAPSASVSGSGGAPVDPYPGCHQCQASIGGWQNWVGACGTATSSGRYLQSLGVRDIPVCVQGATMGCVPSGLFGGAPPNCAAG